jgi:trehalose 6-phosphate phosphatase
VKDLLAATHAKVLTRFAWSNVLVGLDFDGTLAPIVARPEAAVLRASTRALLTELSARYPVVVISGRARDDVAARLEGTNVDAVVGNHGLEPGGDTARCRRTVARWLPVLHRHLDAHPGVEIENKVFSVAVHYRRSRQRRMALEAIREAVREIGPGHRWVDGKLVVNLLPEQAPHKGVALVRQREHFGADTALYVGDDVTDEDVFSLDDPGRLLSVRVGRSSSTHAPYFIRSQRSIDELLARLVELRPTQQHRRREGAFG